MVVNYGVIGIDCTNREQCVELTPTKSSPMEHIPANLEPYKTVPLVGTGVVHVTCGFEDK